MAAASPVADGLRDCRLDARPDSTVGEFATGRLHHDSGRRDADELPT